MDPPKNTTEEMQKEEDSSAAQTDLFEQNTESNPQGESNLELGAGVGSQEQQGRNTEDSRRMVAGSSSAIGEANKKTDPSSSRNCGVEIRESDQAVRSQEQDHLVANEIANVVPDPPQEHGVGLGINITDMILELVDSLEAAMHYDWSHAAFTMVDDPNIPNQSRNQYFLWIPRNEIVQQQPPVRNVAPVQNQSPIPRPAQHSAPTNHMTSFTSRAPYQFPTRPMPDPRVHQQQQYPMPPPNQNMVPMPPYGVHQNWFNQPFGTRHDPNLVPGQAQQGQMFPLPAPWPFPLIRPMMYNQMDLNQVRGQAAIQPGMHNQQMYPNQVSRPAPIWPGMYNQQDQRVPNVAEFRRAPRTPVRIRAPDDANDGQPIRPAAPGPEGDQ